MNKKTNQSKPLTLKEGYFFKRQFDGFEGMEENSKNWEHHCTYQLRPSALAGEYQVLQLHSMQLLHAKRAGGFMHDVSSAQDCITVGVVEECADKVYFHRTKFQTGDILFFDDSRLYSMMSNDAVVFTVLSIRKNMTGSLIPKLSAALNHTIRDTDAILVRTMRQVRERFINDTNEKRDTKDFKNAEQEICAVIMKLLDEQTPVFPKLSRGEEIALAICDQVSLHMDGKINIASLAKQYQVSEKTLQKSFKSLFGYTPKYFFRQLKLNHAYHDLKYADPLYGKVSKIASKWGFVHMGRFTNYYTALFGENPSQTLMSLSPREEFIEKSCADRQDEIS